MFQLMVQRGEGMGNDKELRVPNLDDDLSSPTTR